MPIAANHTDQLSHGKRPPSSSMQQRVMGEILRPLERARAVRGDGRAAYGHEPLPEEPQGTRGSHRFATVAHGEVDALAIEIEYPVVGGDEHIDGGKQRAETDRRGISQTEANG